MRETYCYVQAIKSNIEPGEMDGDDKLVAVAVPEDPVDWEEESGDVAVASRGVDDKVSPSSASASWELDANKLVFVIAFNVSEVCIMLAKS